MADFVLVHGAWLGAWCWKRVLPGLWSGGHRAYPVSLTGVGERAHQLSPSIGLATHIDDVAAVIETEELTRVILAGHSYAGLLITAVANRMAERIGHLVYLDAVVARSGESWSSIHDDATRKSRRDSIARTGAIPPPDPAAFGLSGADAEWVGRRQCPHPGGMYEEPLEFDEARVAALPRTFVDCNRPALPSVAASRARVRGEPGWRVLEIATGHTPMVSEPGRLLEILRETAAG